jgi:hypothetical protein
MEPFKTLALTWERFGLWREECEAWSEAMGAFDQAIDLQSKVYRVTKDTGSLKAAAHLFLRNAKLAQRMMKPESAVRCALAAATRFETVAGAKPRFNPDDWLDWAHAALLLAELNAPPPKDGRPWTDIAEKALNFPFENQDKLTEQEFQRLSLLKQTLTARR